MSIGRNRSHGAWAALVLVAVCGVAGSRPAAAQDLVDTQPILADVQAPALSDSMTNSPVMLNTAETPRPHSRTLFHSAVIANVAGNLFDGLTTVTEIGGTAREANPLLGQHPVRIMLLKGLFTIPQILAEKHLMDHGHPRIAVWLGYAAGTFAASLAIHNLQTGH